MFDFRYSLRTLLGLIVLVSILIAVGTQWRYYDRLNTRFLDPGALEAQTLLIEPLVVESEGVSTVEYTANYRDVRWLFSQAQDEVELSGGLQAEFDNDRVVLRAARAGDLQQLVKHMTQADRLEGDHAVIRGVAVDEQERPVPYVPVDLLGPTLHSNQCLTRADGSFSLLVQARLGNGYALRFRRSYVQSYLSMPFTLEAEKREVVLKVVLPSEG